MAITSLFRLCLPALLVSGTTTGWAQDTVNSLKNPSFEQDLAQGWEKRTPDDADRKLLRVEGQGRSGSACLVLENTKPTATRLRQGADGTLRLPAGALIEFSAWVQNEMQPPGVASLQFYCMDSKGKILAQPSARAKDLPQPPPSHVGRPSGTELPTGSRTGSKSSTVDRSDEWTQVRLMVRVPEGTEHCMAYLQIQGAVGKARFDDACVRILRQPHTEPPLAKVGLLTDLADDDPCHRNVRILLASEIVPLHEASLAADLKDCVGAVVLMKKPALAPATLEALATFARQGGRVFLDLRSLAAWQSLATATVKLADDTPAQPDASPATRKMRVGLRVAKTSPVTNGFEAGQIIPYADAKGQLLVLDSSELPKTTEILAVARGDKPALVRMAMGKGQIVSADVLSLREPHAANVDAYYKYLFLANTLADPDTLGLAEFYPRKMTYAELVDYMRQLAQAFAGTIRFQEEGPACNDYKLYSLNLGREDGPLYFLYAACHGSEWEPGYGLMTFAKRLAQGRLKDVVDLNKVAVKIVPILNPSGYDARKRQNAHGVDCNRQGDYEWDRYQGRDSNNDGAYGPYDYDWKGTSPFSEPETQTYLRIAQSPRLHCILDYHGNSSGANNELAILPVTAREDNQLRAMDLQTIVNRRLARRYILMQTDDKDFSPYQLERIQFNSGRPVLMNTSARDRYGVCVELTAGYGDSYGTVLQTEVTCEICRALFIAFPAP